MKIDDLKKMMFAKSIAVVGASNKQGSVGNEVMLRLIQGGYKGKLFPVNLKEEKIEEIDCFKSVVDITEKVDLAVIAVPSKIVPSIIDECHKKKIKNIVIISAGFKEIGGEGVELEKTIKEKIVKYKMTAVGPNCMGIFNAENKMNASFNPTNIPKGKIGFASQSGALIAGLIHILKGRNCGFSQVVSLGNQCDVDVLDLIEFWENDKNTSVIMLYIETISNPIRFREVCSRVSKKKPIVMIKAGRSEVGSQATMSHTGSLAGDDVSAGALIESSGVIREIYIRDFINTCELFSKINLPQGDKIAVLTNAGGPGIIAVDTISDCKLNLAKLSEKTKENLKSVNLPQASVKNPVDIIASATVENYVNSAKILLESNEVDILVVIYLYITLKQDNELALELQKLQEKYPNKTIVGIYQTTEEFFTNYPSLNISVPIYHYIADVIYSLKNIIKFQKNKKITEIENKKIKINKNKIQKIIKENKKENVQTLSTVQSLKIFDAYKLPLADYSVVKSLDEVLKEANKIGYPVVLKISNKKVSHKTDIGGVITNIQNEKELKIEWKKLTATIKKLGLEESTDGIVVMKQVKSSGREFAMGIIKKSTGHFAMFGLGGIFVEQLNEVMFRPCPLCDNDISDLINNTKATKLLGAVRGMPEVDKLKLKKALFALSQIVEDFPEIKEIDANPLMVDTNGNIVCVDARFVV